MSRLSRKYGSLDAPQPYRPPEPATGIALPSIFKNHALRSKSVAQITPAYSRFYSQLCIILIDVLVVFLNRPRKRRDTTFNILFNSLSALPTDGTQRETLTGSLSTKRNKLRGLSPRANYTDRATAAYRPS
jgi:hypothetical protein